MKLIYEELLLSIAPRLIQKNRKNILLVIEKLIQKYLIDNIKFLVLLDRINELTEMELNKIQEDLSVDFYSYSMTLEEKRKSCKESLMIHRTKGTSGAVKKVLNIFFENAKLEEWYEYSGVPGYFRVGVSGVTPLNLEEIIKRIDLVKKKSQHLEKITFSSKNELKLNTFSFKRSGIRQKHYQSPISFSFERNKLKNNSGNRQQIKRRYNVSF